MFPNLVRIYVMSRMTFITVTSPQHHSISNHWQLNCLFYNLFRLTSKKTSKAVLLALCEGNPPVTGGFPSQRASKMESISMSWHKKQVHIFKTVAVGGCNLHLIEFYWHWGFKFSIFDVVTSYDIKKNNENKSSEKWHWLKCTCIVFLGITVIIFFGFLP